MKKAKRTINGRTVKIEIEENDLAIVLSTKDTAFIDEYFLIVHKEQLKDRAETRRHQSLEVSISNGHDFADMAADIEVNFEREERLTEMLSCLTDEQKKIAIKIFIDGYSQKELAEELGIAKSSMAERAERIKERLRKNLKNIT